MTSPKSNKKIQKSDQPIIPEICPNVSHMINSHTETEDFKSRNPILWTAGDLRLQTMDPATKLHCTCNMSGMTCCMVVPQKTTIFFRLSFEGENVAILCGNWAISVPSFLNCGDEHFLPKVPSSGRLSPQIDLWGSTVRGFKSCLNQHFPQDCLKCLNSSKDCLETRNKMLRRLCHSISLSWDGFLILSHDCQSGKKKPSWINPNDVLSIQTQQIIAWFLKTSCSTLSSRKQMFFVPKEMSQGIEDKNWSLSLRASWGWSHGVKGSTSQEGKEIASSWITGCGRCWLW